MPLQEDCPICKVISAGEVSVVGKHCCLIKIGGQRIAALNEHSNHSGGEALAEAVELLKHDGTHFLTDYSEVPAHWGLRLLPVVDLPDGQSRGGSK